MGPAAPWPNRCVRRRRAASEPGWPGRCRTSTLRTRNVGSLDGREGSGLQAFQEHNARSHFAVSATEAQEPLSKGRVWEGSVTWRRPLRGSRSIGVRYEAEGDEIASSPPPRGNRGGDKRPSLGSEAANSLLALPAHRAPARLPGASHGLGALPRPPGLRSYPAGLQSPDGGATSLKTVPNSCEQGEREGAGPRAGREALRDPRTRAMSTSRDREPVAGPRD